LAGKFAGIYFIAGLSCQQQKALEPGKSTDGTDDADFLFL
jgi:hypothetical protein